MTWCVVDVLYGRWMVSSGTNVSTAQRSLRSRVTLCVTFAFTRMKSLTSVLTASDHLPSRVRWRHTPKHTPVLKTSNAKSVRSYSLRRAASRSIFGCTLVSIMYYDNDINVDNNNNNNNKPVGDWISAPSPNFIAMATGVGPQHFPRFHWIGHPRKPPGRPKHLRSTSQLIGDFANFGEKILGIRGPKSKIEENGFAEGHMEKWRPKNGSIPSRNKKEAIWRSVTDGQTSGQTDRVSCWQ